MYQHTLKSVFLVSKLLQHWY